MTILSVVTLIFRKEFDTEIFDSVFEDGTQEIVSKLYKLFQF